MMFSRKQIDMMNMRTSSKALIQALCQRAGIGASMLLLMFSLVGCGGGGGGSTPRFVLDTATGVLKDNATGLQWAQVSSGGPTSTQRWPTVDELLYLTDKTTLTEMPTQFSATLLNNDLVFAGDVNNSRANGVWSVSFAADSRGAVYSVDSTEVPTAATPTPKQPVVVTSGSAAPFYRSRAASNYTTAVSKGVLVTYDKENDLSWKTCSEGMTLSVITCAGTPTMYSLSELAALTIPDGWRLPTRYELAGLLDRANGPLATTKSYMLNTSYFDILQSPPAWWDASVLTFPPRIYWSSTQDTGGKKFVVSYDEGSIRPDTGGSYYVRLVRSGKY